MAKRSKEPPSGHQKAGVSSAAGQPRWDRRGAARASAQGKANSSREVLRFAEELIARVARAGAGGEKLLRADSAFWNNTLMKRLEQAGWRYSISIRAQKGVVERIASIAESDWQTLADYPADGKRRSPRRPTPTSA
jgi:hypothetical protein